MRFSQAQGFTLIEILVVVVIVSVLTVMGVQMVSSGSVERNLQQHGKILQSLMNYACDQATFVNRPFGVKFSNNGYTFSQFFNQQWQMLDTDKVQYYQELTDGSVLQLQIDGQSVVLTDELPQNPQVMCDSSGQLSDFTLTISDASLQHHYQLQRKEFWQISSKWLDEKQTH